MNLAKTLPPRPSQVLERERLINKLMSWEEKKLVVIHGQAGQGKSTLASGYLHAASSPALWYNLDQEDDNPSVFLSTLGQAVMQTFPAHAPKLPPVPRDRHGTSEPSQAISRWISEAFSGLPPSSLIVFDDYNAVSSPVNMPHLLKDLIDSTPPNVRFILISRTQPEIETASLRAKRAFGEITGDDLRFSDAEVGDLFGSVFGMRLAANEASLINRTAEGWAAGLVLMHEYISSAASRSRASFLSDRMPGGYRSHVFEYLAQEVFSHLPSGMQDFLLRTSIVDHLPTRLMELLTGLPAEASKGRDSTQAMVRELRRKNLFVSAVDDEATVVRYHSLFREFLHKKLLAQTRPSEVKRLYSVAAEYFSKSGDPVRTINLFISSGQYDKAARRMEESGLELIARGQTQTLLRWIEALPAEFGSRPWFLFYRAVASRFTAPKAALGLFDRALAGFRSGGSVQGRMLSLGGIIEACFHSGGGFRRMQSAATKAHTVLRRHRSASPDARARLLFAMGTAYFFIGRLRDGVDALRQALDLFRKAGDHFYQISCVIYLTPCSLYLGDFRLAREAVGKGFEALKFIPDEKGGEAALHMALAMTALIEGNFDEAQDSIDVCRRLAGEHRLEAIDFLYIEIGGWLKIAQGDYAVAERLLTDGKLRAAESGNAFISATSAHLLAIAHMFQGDLNKAKKESDYALAVRSQADSSLFHSIYLIASGAINLRLGKKAQAEKELTAALRTLQRVGAAQQEVNARLVLAQLNRETRKTDVFRRHLREAFTIGRERGFAYYSLFTAGELAGLANVAIENDICADYCSDLLDAIEKRRGIQRLRVHCLGGFRVYANQALIKDSQWKSRLAKALIKILAAHAGRKLTRDTIADMLRPDTGADSTRSSFNSMLYRARKALEPENADGATGSCILQEGDLLSLNNRVVWTDVGEFMNRLDAAGRHKKANDLKRALAECEKGLALYQGDFLPNDAYEDWAGPVRDRVRDAYLKALEFAGEAAESLGEKEKAVYFFDKLFHDDPCNENACRWLMAHHLSAGQRSRSLKIYDRCQMALRKELDLEPDGQTKRLYRSIVGG